MRFEGPPPEPLASALGFLLSWSGQRMAHRFAEALEPLGLRPSDFGVMTLIATHPGCAQTELVTGSLVDPSSMVAVIDELESEGLAERRKHPDDRRKHAVHLTPKGRRKLESAREVAVAMTDDALAPLSAKERVTLQALLRKAAGVED